MKLWRWQKGRQADCEYSKFPIILLKIWKFGFDAYILKYAPNASLPWHTDRVENGKHWRLNIKLSGNAIFGIKKDGVTKHLINKSFILFRSDLNEHSLEVSKRGCLKLSFGFVKFD